MERMTRREKQQDRDRHRYNWKYELSKLLHAHAGTAAHRNKIVGDRTRQKRGEILFLAFAQLHEMGLKLRHPKNFREKHVVALVKRWEEEGIAPATLQNRISTLRVFCQWIGKGNMVKASVEYVANPNCVKRTTAAQEDKSWEAQGVNILAKIREVELTDRLVALQLLFMHAFGARRAEAVCFRPFKGDYGYAIELVDQTKGGQRRFVPIEHDFQRRVLETCKVAAKTKNGHIGQPDRTLEQSLRRFDYVLEKHGITRKGLGVTSHGLRHGFLNDFYESRAGIPSPVRGGGRPAPDVELVARAQTAQVAGHTRTSITTAYTGSYDRTGKPAREPKRKPPTGLDWCIPLGAPEPAPASDDLEDGLII